MIPDDLKQYDYRNNIIIDKDNPILIWKAWRDHFTDGRAYLSVSHSEDALTWNVFRRLQLNKPELISEIFNISKIERILFWGCDIESRGEEQQILNILIRKTDGKFMGTMTEPDLVIITSKEVVFAECKLNHSGKTSPWKAKGEGWKKRFKVYSGKIQELESIPENDRSDLYQLIRQYVYAKLLSCQLGKEPFVIPIINEKHKDILDNYYSKIKKYIGVKNVFRDFITWQDIKEKASHLIEIQVKIQEALKEAR